MADSSSRQFFLPNYSGGSVYDPKTRSIKQVQSVVDQFKKRNSMRESGQLGKGSCECRHQAKKALLRGEHNARRGAEDLTVTICGLAPTSRRIVHRAGSKQPLSRFLRPCCTSRAWMPPSSIPPDEIPKLRMKGPRSCTTSSWKSICRGRLSNDDLQLLNRRLDQREADPASDVYQNMILNIV
jgi:hypothetical protein